MTSDAVLLTVCAEYIRANEEFDKLETTEDGEFKYKELCEYWNGIKDNSVRFITKSEADSIVGLRAKAEIIMLEWLQNEPVAFEWPNSKLREIAKAAAALL